MLVNRVTFIEPVLDDSRGPKTIIQEFDKIGNLVCVRLPDIPNTAQVFRINENGDHIPFKIDEPIVHQEFEKDPFTANQTEEYKRTLYSKVGLRLINKLKNSRLITRNQFESILSCIKGINVKTVMGIPAIKLLFQEEPKFRKFKHVNFNVEQFCFNKIPLKDLGITKEDVINLFRRERLINF